MGYVAKLKTQKPHVDVLDGLVLVPELISTENGIVAANLISSSLGASAGCHYQSGLIKSVVCGDKKCVLMLQLFLCVCK